MNEYLAIVNITATVLLIIRVVCFFVIKYVIKTKFKINDIINYFISPEYGALKLAIENKELESEIEFLNIKIKSLEIKIMDYKLVIMEKSKSENL